MRKMCAGLVVFFLTIPAWAQDVANPDSAEKPRREPLHLSLDWTLGFGKVNVVDQAAYPASGQRAPTPTLGQAQVGLNTFIVAGAYDVTENARLGLRIPFTYGNFANVTHEGGRAIALGNFEITGELRRKLSDQLTVAAMLGIALPTSLGTELPTQRELDAIPPESYRATEANKFSINQAAAAAFGYEQNQLFWSKRFGLTPGIEARWQKDKLRLTPFVRMLNLIDTHDTSVERYRMEFVFGASAGYRVIDWLDLGVRVWGAVAPVRRDVAGNPIGAGVASPEVRVLFGARKEHNVYVAAVLPFVGSNVDPYYFGAFRAGVAGTF